MAREFDYDGSPEDDLNLWEQELANIPAPVTETCVSTGETIGGIELHVATDRLRLIIEVLDHHPIIVLSNN